MQPVPGALGLPSWFWIFLQCSVMHSIPKQTLKLHGNFPPSPLLVQLMRIEMTGSPWYFMLVTNSTLRYRILPCSHIWISWSTVGQRLLLGGGCPLDQSQCQQKEEEDYWDIAPSDLVHLAAALLPHIPTGVLSYVPRMERSTLYPLWFGVSSDTVLHQ